MCMTCLSYIAYHKHDSLPIATAVGYLTSRVCSESRCAVRLRYVDLVVSIKVGVEVCCCFTVFGWKTAVEVQ
jgi:hypothetical protein